MPIQAKTPQEIIEFYKGTIKYAQNHPISIHPVGEYLVDQFRSSMQSLLLHVMGEMVSKEQTWDEFWKARVAQVGEDNPTDERECKEYWRTRYDAIQSCLAVIQSTIDSIKE